MKLINAKINTLSPQNQMPDYQKILEMIYRGLFEEAAAEIRKLRKQNTILWNADLSLMQHLLAARIALKSGFIPDNIGDLQLSHDTSPFLAGEIFFVKGIVHYQAGRMAEGILAYKTAQNFFATTEFKDKELVCYYNILIGESHLLNKPLTKELHDFRQLQIQADKYAQNKIIGLVFRQKSYLYKEHNKLNAALAEAEKSIPLLELYCADSDFQLGLLNITEILLELNELNMAQKYFEMLIEPIDKRVQFPKAYLEFRLFGKPIEKESKEQSCPHFLQRYQLWLSKNDISNLALREDHADKIIVSGNHNNIVSANHNNNVSIKHNNNVSIKHNNNVSIKHNNNQNYRKVQIEGEEQKIHIFFNQQKMSFKRNCLESKLIEVLHKGPKSKNLICEKLWPEYSESHHLDNRLHRLISRINKKVSGLILYSAKTYRLCGET